MEKTGWKITAIIFIILFAVETSIVFYGFYLNSKDVERTNICYYKLCSDYPEAMYSNNICTCYEYDVLGNLKVAKTNYMD